MKFTKILTFLIGVTLFGVESVYGQDKYCFFSDNSTAQGYNQLLIYEHYSPLIKHDPSEVSSDDLYRSWYNYLRSRLSRHTLNFNDYGAICRIDDKAGLAAYRQKLVDKSKSTSNKFDHHSTWDYNRDYFSNVNAGAWPRWEYHHLLVR